MADLASPPQPRARGEGALDAAFAVLTLVNLAPMVKQRGLDAVVIAVASVAALTAVAFAVRSRSMAAAPMPHQTVAVLALCSGPVTAALAPDPLSWGRGPQVLGIFGLVIVAIGVFALRKSFGILIAARGLVTDGPYRLVRHPIYFGEILLLVAIAAAAASWACTAAVVAAIGLLVVRIRLEEAFLTNSLAYADYAARVPYRLVWGLW